MPEKDYPRHLIAELEATLKSARIVNLIGPRQVGKTTAVRDLFDRGVYITLDDEAVLEALHADPVGQLTDLAAGLEGSPLIIDEAQRSKKLALAIKSIVDKDKRKGQFLITGSSNVFATSEVADSLAGRMRTLKLWPLTISEIRRASPNHLLDWALQKTPQLSQIEPPEKLTRAQYIELILEGGFPEPRAEELKQRQNLYRDYVDAIVDRDVADLLRIRKTDRLRRLIDQMAARTSAEINVSELSSILAIKRETIDQYLDVLMRLSLVIKLGAWTSGESRREIRNAKYHFVDTGMVCAIRRFGASTFNLGSVHVSQFGGLLESFVFNEVMRALPQLQNDFRLYHWRSADKREIDIIADGGEHIVGIEIKSSMTVGNGDFKHLKWFAKDGPGKTRNFTGIVFYLGEHKLSFGERNFALPVSSLWSTPTA